MFGGAEKEASVLVVDDERNIRDVLSLGLGQAGFLVHTAANGIEGVSAAARLTPDIILLDLMMPYADGMSVLPQLRRATQAPIIILTGKGSLQDQVDGLDSGADDYMRKPFEFPELAARIRAALRRPALTHVHALRFADLTVDLDTHYVRRGGTPIRLSAREFDLLVVLLRRPRQVFTRDQLLDLVWGSERNVTFQVVETYICYLRRKVDIGFPTRLIHTIRGFGYSIRE